MAPQSLGFGGGLVTTGLGALVTTGFGGGLVAMGLGGFVTFSSVVEK